jgi:hypothetical protein
VIFRSKFRQKFYDDASKIWIRCTQNSLKKLEGAELSMQLRGLIAGSQAHFPRLEGKKLKRDIKYFRTTGRKHLYIR